MKRKVREKLKTLREVIIANFDWKYYRVFPKTVSVNDKTKKKF
jgi:hypothetical protein